MFENATVKQLHTYLSVRSCDSNSAKEIGKIFGGERVQCIRDGNNGYCYVRYHEKDGSKEGWVHAQYLVKDHAQSAAPKAAAKAKPAAVESSRNGSSGNEQSADNSSSVESPQSENSSINLIGFGLQLEIDIGCVTIGIEIVWYISSQVDVGGASRCIPYIYVYGGGGLGSSLDSIVSNILNNPSRLANPKSIFGSNSASASVFAIFGYSNFSNPNDYSGPFTSVSATVWNVKSYISWSSTCVVAGIGWSSSPFGASSSETDYYLMNNIDADFSNLENYVYGQAQNIKAPY